MQANIGFVSADCLRKCDVKYYLYVLRDPDTNQVRYVGCCEKPKARLRSHATGTYRPKWVKIWVDALTARGKLPLMEIVGTCVGKINAVRREFDLIDYWHAIVGHDLLNCQGVYDFFCIDRLRAKAKELRKQIDRAEYWRIEREKAYADAHAKYQRMYGIEHNGTYKLVAEWAKELGLSRNTMHQRLRKWPKERALSTPNLKK